MKLAPKTEKALLRLQGLIIESSKDLDTIPDREADFLHRQALISTVGASTRIENAILTDQEIEWVDSTIGEDGKITAFLANKELILDKLSKDRERSLEEVLGCKALIQIIYEQHNEMRPLTETQIRALHHELLRYYPKASSYAGNYKAVPNKVISRNQETGEEIAVLDPASPGVITETAMAALTEWYNSVSQVATWPLVFGVEFVFRFLAIHPFQDGNGRLGRALLLLALLQNGDKYIRKVLPCISIDRSIEKNKVRYYSVLHQASGGQFYSDPEKYNLQPLLSYYMKMLESALQDIEVNRTKFADLEKLSSTAMEVLQCFKASPERKLQVSDIEKQLQIPRRTCQYALKTLSEKEFLQRLGSGAGSRYQLIF